MPPKKGAKNQKGKAAKTQTKEEKSPSRENSPIVIYEITLENYRTTSIPHQTRYNK